MGGCEKRRAAALRALAHHCEVEFLLLGEPGHHVPLLDGGLADGEVCGVVHLLMKCQEAI